MDRLKAICLQQLLKVTTGKLVNEQRMWSSMAYLYYPCLHCQGAKKGVRHEQTPLGKLDHENVFDLKQIALIRGIASCTQDRQYLGHA